LAARSFFSATRPTGPGAPRQRTLGVDARVWQGAEDIGAPERQLPKLAHLELCARCTAGFVVSILATFQDQLVFYLTPTDARALLHRSKPAAGSAG
jgi:hypothetical protein